MPTSPLHHHHHHRPLSHVGSGLLYLVYAGIPHAGGADPSAERDWRFYPSVGAILLVAALTHSPRDGLLVRGLESRLIQHLGRISYSLYLVHGPVMHGVRYRVFPLIWAAVGRDGW
jgi:peptidoglycan/LPS O-acetylase OafA/YrhL